MKRWILSFFVLLVLISFSYAQFKKGDVELAFSGSMGTVKSTSTSGGQTNPYSRNYVFLSMAPGFFISDGLSLEVELGLFAYEQIAPSESIIGNLSYTSFSPGGKFAPFIRGGFGLTNSLPFPVPGGVLLRNSNKFDINILNIGGGLKFVLKTNAILRVEINYRKYSWSEEFSFLLLKNMIIHFPIRGYCSAFPFYFKLFVYFNDFDRFMLTTQPKT